MLKKPIASALLVLGFLLQPLMAVEAAKVNLTVVGKVTSETEREKKDPKAKDPKAKKEVSLKTLEIRINSVSATDPGPLKVKCSFLARDIGTKTNVVHKEITLDAKLDHNQVTLKTEPVAFETTSAYTPKNGEKVDAAGHDFRGFEILVMNSAGEVIGKGYSSRAIQEEIEKAAKP